MVSRFLNAVTRISPSHKSGAHSFPIRVLTLGSQSAGIKTVTRSGSLPLCQLSPAPDPQLFLPLAAGDESFYILPRGLLTFTLHP